MSHIWIVDNDERSIHLYKVRETDKFWITDSGKRFRKGGKGLFDSYEECDEHIYRHLADEDAIGSHARSGVNYSIYLEWQDDPATRTYKSKAERNVDAETLGEDKVDDSIEYLREHIGDQEDSVISAFHDFYLEYKRYA